MFCNEKIEQKICNGYLSLLYFCSHLMRHATCWYGVKGNMVDQSCFKSFTGLRSGSLKFGEEIHDYEEYYKYGHVRQTYPWNKHTCTWNSENQTHYHMNGGDRRGSFLWIRVQISAFKVFFTHLNHKCIGSTKLGYLNQELGNVSCKMIHRIS
jgi:hypothetical protein